MRLQDLVPQRNCSLFLASCRLWSSFFSFCGIPPPPYRLLKPMVSIGLSSHKDFIRAWRHKLNCIVPQSLWNQQVKLLSQVRVVQAQRYKSMKLLHEQYSKNSSYSAIETRLKICSESNCFEIAKCIGYYLCGMFFEMKSQTNEEVLQLNFLSHTMRHTRHHYTSKFVQNADTVLTDKQ